MARQTILRCVLLVLLSLSGVYVSGEGKETWGYVNVREKSHMFFWLYYTTAPVDFSQRPLVLWLQGGPGASSTGIGNFQEIGPLDVNLKNRTTAWTKVVNVLFVDNPVGTGYSYVEDPDLLPRNNTAVANDLVIFMTAFLKKLPEFENVPLYIFTESYGGKMGARFAQALAKAIKQKKLKCQLAGVVMGDSWVSPVDAVTSWGPYLYATSLVDSAGEVLIDNKTKQIAASVKAGKMAEATKLWAESERLVENITNGVNFYNILKKREQRNSPNSILSGGTGGCVFKSPDDEYLYHHHVSDLEPVDMSALMNGPIKEKLKVIPQNVTWGGQSAMVFEALSEDFMTSAVQSVETLLNTTTMKVVVYNGQLDLIVNAPGAQKWVENMKWGGTKQWVGAKRKPLERTGSGTVAFSKSFKNFTFYWILNAGHMVPADVGDVALRVMQEIVGVKRRQ